MTGENNVILSGSSRRESGIRFKKAGKSASRHHHPWTDIPHVYGYRKYHRGSGSTARRDMGYRVPYSFCDCGLLIC